MSSHRVKDESAFAKMLRRDKLDCWMDEWVIGFEKIVHS